ncbi:MAG: hypothetical protein Q8Q09_03280 [Deltaproteobacteria bacterium]|nr:hypothetical protein [Deltaproteobacteria bacterium]
MSITGVSTRSTGTQREVTFEGGEQVPVRASGGLDRAEQARRLSGSQVCLQDGDTQRCETVDTAAAHESAVARRDAAAARMNEQRAVHTARGYVMELPRPARSAPGGVSSERGAEAFAQCGDRTRTRPNVGMVASQLLSAGVSMFSMGREAGTAEAFVAPSIAHALGHVGIEVAVDLGLSHAVGHALHSSDPRSPAEHVLVATADAVLPGAGTLVSSVVHEVLERDAQIDCMETAARQARRHRNEGRSAADGIRSPERPLEGLDIPRLGTDRDYYDGVVQRLNERARGAGGVRG